MARAVVQAEIMVTAARATVNPLQTVSTLLRRPMQVACDVPPSPRWVNLPLCRQGCIIIDAMILVECVPGWPGWNAGIFGGIMKTNMKAAGLWLAGLVSVSCAWGDPVTQVQIDGTAVNAMMRARQQTLVAYARQVNEIVVARVRQIRVQQEQGLMKQSGHPVPLPTGLCRAIVSVAADGSLSRAQLASCASPELGDFLLRAINLSAPFAPLGYNAIFPVQASMPVATPGVFGN